MTRTLTLALALLALAACDWSTQRMVDQDRCERDEPTRLFPDGNCDRPLPEGVVPWHASGPPRAAPATAPPRTRALVERGHDRFDGFCAPCHGLLGDGDSQVAENMLLRPPPSLHEARLVALSDARLFEIVTRGYGLMPSYRARLSEADRWAVIAYVRVLELSQDVPLDRLSPGQQEEARPWLR